MCTFPLDLFSRAQDGLWKDRWQLSRCFAARLQETEKKRNLNNVVDLGS